MRRLGNVVLDVNVIISLVLKNKLGLLLRAVAFDRVTVFASAELLDELLDVLNRPHLARYLAESPTAYFQAFEETALFRPILKPYAGSPDPDDDYLVALCLQEKAWLVSGDGPLLRWEAPPAGLKRMTYTEFQKRVL